MNPVLYSAGVRAKDRKQELTWTAFATAQHSALRYRRRWLHPQVFHRRATPQMASAQVTWPWWENRTGAMGVAAQPTQIRLLSMAITMMLIYSPHRSPIASRTWAKTSDRARFIASLVLFAKDMPEQEGAPGNIFKGPLFAFVMVLIGTMTLLMTFYMLVAEYCGIESPKDAQEAAGSVASSLRRFSRGRLASSSRNVIHQRPTTPTPPRRRSSSRRTATMPAVTNKGKVDALSGTGIKRTRAPTAAASTPAARPCPPGSERRRLY